MSENIFDPTWLNTRFPFDEAARNSEVDSAVFQYLVTGLSSQKEVLNFLDVGAGTGANFLHFFEKINSPQNWTFLDHDPLVLAASKRRICEYATARNYPFQETTTGLVLTCANKKIQIKLVAGDFEKIETFVDLKKIDLVLASAFFDLFRVNQLNPFLEKVFANKCALLLTLNYLDMRFSPGSFIDASVTQWYADHMQRPKPEGQAMGPDCSSAIQAFLEEQNIPFTKGKSTWQIGGRDVKMLGFLLGFIESSMEELALSKKDLLNFDMWLLLRKEQLRQELLRIEVDHFDFFASQEK